VGPLAEHNWLHLEGFERGLSDFGDVKGRRIEDSSFVCAFRSRRESAMQEMAMLSQAHKCLASSLFHSSSCTRASYHPRLRSLRRELGFAPPQLQSLGCRRTCGRLLVTGTDYSMGLCFHTQLAVWNDTSHRFHVPWRVRKENGFVVFRTNVRFEAESTLVTESAIHA